MTIDDVLNEFEANVEQLNPEQTPAPVKQYAIEQINLIRTMLQEQNKLDTPNKGQVRTR